MQHDPMMPMDPDMGGNPGRMIEMRKRYNDYAIQTQTNGEPTMPFEEWVRMQQPMQGASLRMMR